MPTTHSSTYSRITCRLRPTWMLEYGSPTPRKERSGSHCKCTCAAANCSVHSSGEANTPGTNEVRTARDNAFSHPARLIRTARTRSWPLFCPQLLRCISHKNDGLIQLMRWNENGGTN